MERDKVEKMGDICNTVKKNDLSNKWDKGAGKRFLNPALAHGTSCLIPSHRAWEQAEV